MRKSFFIILLLLVASIGYAQKSVYNFNESGIAFSGFSGKRILIVNIASSSSRASQLADLEVLHQRYKDSGLVIVAFPSNDFNNESKSNQELNNLFAGRDYHFKLGTKLSIRGRNISPIYEWLTTQASNGTMDVPVNGDFQKFLINRAGKLVGVFSGAVGPLHESIIEGLNIYK
jgi:glutathione peroxidase